MSKMIKCKNCGADIVANATACPSCGVKVKKPFYKRWWFITAVILSVIIAISNSSGKDAPDTDTHFEQNTTVEQNAVAETITYEPCTTDELVKALEENALAATEKYKGKYIELRGELNVIDGSGEYISLDPEHIDFSLTPVRCDIKNDEQRSHVATLKKGDVVILRGKITDIGEILGYSIDIDSFVE